MTSLTEQRISQRQSAIATAFYLAEAGIDDAIVRLRVDNMYSGTTPATTSLGIKGEFETTVTQFDPTDQPAVRRIESLGFTPSKDPSAFGYQMKKLEAYVRVTPNPLFPMAAFAQKELDIIGNSLIDSYDSSKGGYGPGNSGSNGDIGSNNVDAQDGSIEVRGNSTVKGDATVGPSVPYQDAIEVWESSTITGTQFNASNETALPLVVIPEGISNSGDLEISGEDKIVLPGGNYWYSSIEITGNGSLQFTGSSTVYVTGDIEVAGNGITTSNDLPANLIIKVVGEREVKFTGNADFYGGIYAPQSTVQISGEVKAFGAVAGDEVNITGDIGLHYDEALRDVSGGSGYLVTLLAWHEAYD